MNYLKHCAERLRRLMTSGDVVSSRIGGIGAVMG